MEKENNICLYIPKSYLEKVFILMIGYYFKLGPKLKTAAFSYIKIESQNGARSFLKISYLTYLKVKTRINKKIHTR
jgi:hypothetical protein